MQLRREDTALQPSPEAGSAEGKVYCLIPTYRVNRHMLLPAKHVEQLLLLAGNPQELTQSLLIACLDDSMRSSSILLFHSQGPKSSRLCGILQAASQTLMAMTIVISPVNPNEAVQLKIGFI